MYLKSWIRVELEMLAEGAAAAWQRVPAMLRGLGQWMMIVGGCGLIMAAANLEPWARARAFMVIAVLGFALGYLFALLDYTEGFERQSEAERRGNAVASVHMEDS